MDNYDFSGWATRNDLQCSDGVIIRKDAFKGNDGAEVPLIWNHDHTTPEAVLGHAILENRDDGVYAYGKFNDTEAGQNAKKLVENGDIRSLSIWANSLKKIGRDVVHGKIRELSLVLAGANPGAYVDFVMAHSDDSEEEFIANYDECGIIIYHSAEKKEEKTEEVETAEEAVEAVEEAVEENSEVLHAEEKVEENKKEDKEMAEETKKTETAKSEDEETVADVFNTLTEKQKTVVYAMIGQALEDAASDDEDDDDEDEEVKHSYEGGNVMKYNAFDTEEEVKGGVISHADQAAILELAKDSTVGTLKKAIEIYAANNKDVLAHGIDEIEKLFPDYKDVHPGAPELIERDQKWVQTVIRKAHKSPVSRVRMRQVDARAAELKAKGYNNREEQKALSGNLKLLMRTFDPQTVYYRDELHRDDINDITDFDVVAYQKTVMRHGMEEEIAVAALIGDGREDTHPDKIHEEHIRSVWNDEDLYTIHTDVDIEAAKEELQGTDTGVHFGENYIYAEAIVTAALYSREKYKGKGQLDFYCTPHLLNVMLLARDLNGRRIYDTKEDIAKVLNVGEIYEVEQMEGRTRTDSEGNTKKLLGLFVNMANYQFGSTKGGEITNFENFDIDFNKYKYLMEARLSGALTEIYSAIALEEPVAEGTGL